jgi:superfamily II DNA helicase RecQ
MLFSLVFLIRSAYFRLGRMLRAHIPCRAVLALTATATKSTQGSIVQALCIAPDAVFRDDTIRSNLRFSVSHSNGGLPLPLPPP